MLHLSSMRRIDIRQVLVFGDTSGASGRNILSGIFDYANGGRRWVVHLSNDVAKSAAEVDAIVAKGNIHGIIAEEHRLPNAPEVLKDSTLPLVFLSTSGESGHSRTKAISYVLNDEQNIGRLAAEAFLERGLYQSFAFVPAHPSAAYSEMRQDGYVSRLRAAGIKDIEVFEAKAPAGSADDTRALAKWLASLPKPAAIYAAWDFRAVQVLNACHAAKLSVPKQVAVLGTDDDELLCDSANPPLSSILPDHERAGYVAAQRLDELMRGRKPKNRTLLVNENKVVERETTQAVTTSAHLVGKALAYIKHNATKGIGVQDVVRHLGCSRSLADLRFREHAGTSILKALTAQRMESLKRLLRDTDIPVRQAASRSGFSCLKRLERLFREEEGMSMSEWRAAERRK